MEGAFEGFVGKNWRIHGSLLEFGVADSGRAEMKTPPGPGPGGDAVAKRRKSRSAYRIMNLHDGSCHPDLVRDPGAVKSCAMEKTAMHH